MKSISFDNAWLLLIAIPLLCLILIPYFVAIRRDNRSRSVITSLVLHLLIVVLVTLSLAGMMVTTVVTQTEVYIVADVSYSSHRNLDKIDEYIEDVCADLPANTKVGVICFGKNTTLLTPLGGEMQSVKKARVDESGTDIAGALEYASSLFGGNTVKRVVLITDGKQNAGHETGELISTIDMLYSKDIYLDAIYLNNNIPATAREVQISGVDVTATAYQNQETTADVLIQSNRETQATVYLYRDAEEVARRAVNLDRGYNVINFDLETATPDVTYQYEVRVETVNASDDESSYNNAYTFTQQIAGKLNVLLISSLAEDLAQVERLYGERASITSYINKVTVPCSVEEFCQYDEIILSNVDVRELNNYTAFVDALDKAVSVFGKSLITLGDLRIQNKDDEVLKQLEAMLPVSFGNNEDDPKLYGIVIDTSRSMQNASKLFMAKQAAIQLLNLIRDEDYVTIIAFSGDARIVQPPTPAANRARLVQMIQGLEPTQGTRMDAALEAALSTMQPLNSYANKQVMLIGDGKNHLGSASTSDIAAQLYQNEITVSVIDTAGPEAGTTVLAGIAEAGHGKYYRIDREEDVMDVLFADVADDITETIIERQTPVEIQLGRDKLLDGIAALPDIYGYVYAKTKASSSTVLTVDYVKTSGAVVEVPIYAYRNYGNGQVTTFTSSLANGWLDSWSGNSGETFLQNVLTVNTPDECNDDPYTMSLETSGAYTTVSIVPATLSAKAGANVVLTLPNGRIERSTMIFDGSRYFYTFETPTVGRYSMQIEYTYDQRLYLSDNHFHIPYAAEYDSFATFEASSLYTAVRNRGTVSENGAMKLENNDRDIESYTVSFTVPFLIAAVVLYVVDIIVRKLKWDDIRSLFKKRRA